jgi:16S rRNA processing protein RimM
MKRVVGKVSGFHGIKGEIKIYPLVDDIELFHNFKTIEINDIDYKVEGIRFHKNNVLVLLKDHHDRNSVEKLSGYVQAELNEDLADTEYYISDLIGMTVIDETSSIIGQVRDFSNQGQELIYIRLMEKFAAKSDLIVPFVEDYILDIKVGNHIKINLDQGLLELCQ